MFRIDGDEHALAAGQHRALLVANLGAIEVSASLNVLLLAFNDEGLAERNGFCKLHCHRRRKSHHRSQLVYLPHCFVEKRGNNAAMSVSRRTLVFARQLEFAPGAMVTVVEEELQAHALGIVFAAGEAVVLGKGNVFRVVSGEALGHSLSIIRTNFGTVCGSNEQCWSLVNRTVFDLRPLYHFGVLFLTYIPKAPLSQFVELFWFYDGYTQPHAKERIMPDARCK